MSADRSEPASSKVSWGVQADRRRVEKLTALERECGVLVGTWLDMAFEALEIDPDSQLRAYVEQRVDQPLDLQLKPWRFTVDVVTTVRVKKLARELSVTQSKLVALVIDCLTQDDGDGGGGNGSRSAPKSRRGELLRRIYSSSPNPAPPAAGGLNSGEVVATSTA